MSEQRFSWSSSRLFLALRKADAAPDARECRKIAISDASLALAHSTAVLVDLLPSEIGLVRYY